MLIARDAVVFQADMAQRLSRVQRPISRLFVGQHMIVLGNQQRMGHATRELVWRRWIMLTSADWVPQFICPSRGLPRSSIGDHHADAHIAWSRAPLIGALASRDPCVVGSVVMKRAERCYLLTVSGSSQRYRKFKLWPLTWRAMSQTKAESSRAIATQILFSASLRAERWR